jgi:uncharacterized membrane protein YfcA
MDLTSVLGYLAATLIGISLGLIGGGGSILTVPVLVYLLGIEPVLATAYSLFVVGISSAVGLITYIKKQLVSFRIAFLFGLPSIVSVYLTRLYLLPMIPDTILSIDTFNLSKDMAVMVLFALLMIVASYSMIKGRKEGTAAPTEQKTFNYGLILLEGLTVGMLTGLVGAGGGFLIIPALVILTGIPMKLAVGTSLFIIALKSLIGFTGDMVNFDIDWDLLLPFSAIAIVGIFIGAKLSDYISGQKLKPAFGYFVLVMGLYILISEFV